MTFLIEYVIILVSASKTGRALSAERGTDELDGLVRVRRQRQCQEVGAYRGDGHRGGRSRHGQHDSGAQPALAPGFAVLRPDSVRKRVRDLRVATARGACDLRVGGTARSSQGDRATDVEATVDADAYVQHATPRLYATLLPRQPLQRVRPQEQAQATAHAQRAIATDLGRKGLCILPSSLKNISNFTGVFWLYAFYWFGE